MVANEEGERNGESENGGAEEVRAAEQVGAVRAQGLHGWALGPREMSAPCLASASFGTMRMGWDRRRPGSVTNLGHCRLQFNLFHFFCLVDPAVSKATAIEAAQGKLDLV